MNFFNNPYTCALSGITPKDEDFIDGYDHPPEGWIEITFKRRFFNPKWEAIQNVKQGLIQQTLAAIPEEQREDQLVNVAIQVEAQFQALEDKTEEYMVENQGPFYIAPPEDDPQLLEAYNKLREYLGLEREELEDFEVEEDSMKAASKGMSDLMPEKTVEKEQEVSGV